MLNWVKRHRPPIVILENVCSAPWKEACIHPHSITFLLIPPCRLFSSLNLLIMPLNRHALIPNNIIYPTLVLVAIVSLSIVAQRGHQNNRDPSSPKLGWLVSKTWRGPRAARSTLSYSKAMTRAFGRRGPSWSKMLVWIVARPRQIGAGVRVGIRRRGSRRNWATSGP